MCRSGLGCSLSWVGDDAFLMIPSPTASCTLTQEGDQYVVQFTRNATGSVVALRVEGNGAPTELLRQRPSTHALKTQDENASVQLPACTDHTDVSTFPGTNGRCDQRVRTQADWLARRADIVTGFTAAAGTLPTSRRAPLDMQVMSTIVLPSGVRRMNLTYVAEHATIPAFLYVPAAATAERPAPCVLASHPTSDEGKNYASVRAPPLNYAEELAERGYVVILPDYVGMGGLRSWDFAHSHWPSGTIAAVSNNMRAIDLLESLNYTDTDRLAAIGHSLGGHNSLFTGVLDTRIKIVVSSCGWTPWQYYITASTPLNHTWANAKYMPRIASMFGGDPQRIPFDFYELVAAIAPRPFFSNSPYTDFNFNVSGVWETVPKVRPVWELFGAGSDLHVEYPAGGCMSERGSHDCGHDFPAGTRFESCKCAFAPCLQVLAVLTERIALRRRFHRPAPQGQRCRQSTQDRRRIGTTTHVDSHQVRHLDAILTAAGDNAFRSRAGLRRR